MTGTAMTMDKGLGHKIWAKIQKFQVLAGLLLLCILFSVTTPSFLQMKNVMNVLNQASVNCLLSMGVLLAVLTGGNDLSTGANLALSSMIVAISIKFWGLNPFVGLLLGLAVGAFIGVLNGFMLTKMHMPHPFISTLGMQNVARGLALIVTGAAPDRYRSSPCLFFPKVGSVFGKQHGRCCPYEYHFCSNCSSCFLHLLK